MPKLEDTDAVEDCSQGEAVVPIDISSTAFMPNALWAPDVLHVMHNAVEEILTGMKHAQHWLRQLKTIAGFWKHRDLRELFAAECLVGDATAFRPKVMPIPEVFIDWRWASLIRVCEFLSSIRGMIQIYWDTDRLLSAKQRKTKGG